MKRVMEGLFTMVIGHGMQRVGLPSYTQSSKSRGNTQLPTHHPSPQHLRHRPGLGEAAAGVVGRIAIEDLADAAQPRSGQVIADRLQPLQGLKR